MPEDFELFSAPTAQEKSEKSDEKFREKYRQAQAQIKKIKREESSKKKDDNSLADAIIRFLGQPNRSGFFILISRLVAANVPSDLILAIISLIDPPSEKLITEKFGRISQKFPVPRINFETKKEDEIGSWGRRILAVAFLEPERILKTVLLEEDLRVEVLQLSAFVLREFLGDERSDDFEDLKVFCVQFWETILQILRRHLSEKTGKKLPENS
jgi:hypothetical protein